MTRPTKMQGRLLHYIYLNKYLINLNYWSEATVKVCIRNGWIVVENGVPKITESGIEAMRKYIEWRRSK